MLFFHKIPSILRVSVCLSLCCWAVLWVSLQLLLRSILRTVYLGVGTRVVQGWEYTPPTNVDRLSQHLIMSVEFKVGYLRCYERFSSRYSGFPSKTNTSKLLTVHVYFGQSGTLRHIKTSSQELRSERNLESHFHLFKHRYLYFSH